MHEGLCREGIVAGGLSVERWDSEVGCGGRALVPLRMVVRGNRRQDDLCASGMDSPPP